MIPIKEPWERIDASDEAIHRMFRDWGQSCMKKKMFETGKNYFDQSLEFKENDPKVLCYRSQVNRFLGQPEKALKDSRAAARVDNNNSTINLEICDGLYECNELENFKIELHDNRRKYHGNRAKPFEERIVVVNENFKDSLGDSLSPFILENGKHFPAVLEAEYRRKHPDKRPLWKQLREQEKCDVLSVQDKEELLLSPLEIARRERASDVLHQMYFNNSWEDVRFLKRMRENTNLQLPQAKKSSPFFKNLTCGGYDTVRKFSKMLQTRSPMYNEVVRRCPIKKVCQKQREDNLFRVQYQTRRNMNSILRVVREMRATGQIERLSNFVEEIMGDYVILKTHRVMPWKLEFIVEVYNILALAHIDRYTAARRLTKKKTDERLLELLRMRNEKPKGPVVFVFGDRSTFQEPDAVDKKFIAYKKFIARLEKRMLFAKYGIEKAYLLHEIARSHLKQNRYNECCSAARRAIAEAKAWGSNVWEFLSNMLILKANAVLHKIEGFQEVLFNARMVVERLKCTELQSFMDQCQLLNEDQIITKRQYQSQSSIPVRGSRRGSFMSRRSSFASEVTSGTADTSTNFNAKTRSVSNLSR